MAKSGLDHRAAGRAYDLKSDKVSAMGIGLNSHTLLIIKLPDSRALRILSRSLLLAIVLLTLPSIASVIGGGASPNHGPADIWPDSGLGFIEGPRILPIVLHDLVDEGLIRKGHSGFVLLPSLKAIEGDLDFLRDDGIDLLAGANPTVSETFDFVFLPNFNGIQMIDGIAKSGALVVAPLRHEHDPLNGLRLHTDFKIVYLRRFESTFVALRKIKSDGLPNSKQVSSCRVVTHEKKKKEEALKGLEDVYLEPPRQGKTKSAGRRKKSSFFTSRKIKFLPNLLKDSLDVYRRRVFISDDSRAFDWFYKNYPMNDQEFEVYQLGAGLENKMGSSDWLRRNNVDVGPEDYVVMKAEAVLVEEMLRDRSLCLVDELFLECKNEWDDGKSKSKRAYWQCLALYGRVRDEGIAVHQWWY
ncbi:conserved peptide upstream open reading frame 47 [Striga asiatica]|uniref:Conserved peptide upstream open reading frame 47 n=1 Tax=Striga asiatica TaxID=4170 RepID=A0A5A7REU3_STRAF|nr:conserved peptide upstream open reading frame 47 [Striga asiatica]